MMSEDTGECVSCDKLSEQVEKLRKERNAFQDQCIRLKNERAVEKGQLAALAEQVEKLTEDYDQSGRTVQDYGRIINQTELRLHEVATHCANVEEQLAALTKERDEALDRERNCAIATHRQAYCIQQCASTIGPDTSATIDGLPKAVKRAVGELAALASQNEKMRAFLEFAWKYIPMSEYAFEILEHAMNLPNLATPVLNRIKAEAYREAAEICETTFAHGILQLGHRAAIAKAIRAKADELENSDG